jgi:3',5'-cyclic-AMP phosphodiesterase
MHRLSLLAIAALAAAALTASPQAGAFRFVILGDRTGEPQPGVYEQAWKEAAAENPAFVIATGDTIQGSEDAAAAGQWREIGQVLSPYRRIPLYLVPGNHDVWSPVSEKLFREHAGRPLRYGFDHAGAHIAVLDNSRTEDLPAAELKFLQDDLSGGGAQPLKMVFSHRPSWILQAALGNPGFELHRVAKRYGVRYIVAGHIHQLVRADMEGVTYFSMPSSGAHLRLSGKYEDGWFFGYALVEVGGAEARVTIKELKPPFGEGRVTRLEDWGKAGLLKKDQPSIAPPRVALPGKALHN